MGERNKPIGLDTDGYEIITDAMKELLNQFPGLESGEKVKFEELTVEGGIIFSNNAGALVYTEKKYISGTVYQECKYPFFVVYRISSVKERSRLMANEFLGMLGKWLCRECVLIGSNSYRLTDYPVLTDGREIKRIKRDNAYATEPKENGTQDWVLPVTVEYSNTIKN